MGATCYAPTTIMRFTSGGCPDRFAAQDACQLVRKFVRINRFADEAVEAQLISPVDLADVNRISHDRDIAQALIRLQVLQHIVTTDTGHLDVQKDHIQLVERIQHAIQPFGIGNLGVGHAFVCQQAGENVQIAGVVVNYQGVGHADLLR